jgi:hypothetical protein
VSAFDASLLLSTNSLVFSDLHGNEQLSLIEPGAFDKLTSLEDLFVSGLHV